MEASPIYKHSTKSLKRDPLDEEELVSRIESLSADETGTALENRYRPIYLNLFSLLRKEMSHQRIREIAATVTKSAVWNRHAALKHYISCDRHRPDGFYLDGWQRAIFRDLLSRGKGLIVSSYRFGLYSFLFLEIAKMGFRVVSPVLKSSIRAAECAVGELRAGLDRADIRCSSRQGQLVQALLSVRLLPIEDQGTLIELAKSLRKGEVVLVLADGNNGVDGPWSERARVSVKFFGSDAFVKAGVAKLSSLLGTPILPVVALKTGSQQGVVHLAEPILPAQFSTSSARENFVHASTQHFYVLLESYVRAHPEQWEGVSGLHRWWRASRPSPTQPHSKDPDVLRICEALQAGKRFRINETDGIVPLPGNNAIWIDTRDMTCFRAPGRAEDLSNALTMPDGVDHVWIQGRSTEEEIRQTYLALLAQLEAHALIVAV
jgi:Bacterial lipid A biosynthesis acyltransferase